MGSDGQLFNTATLPMGSYTAKIDANGRIKLPAPIQRFLAQFPSGPVFVTDLAEGFLRLFPMPVWVSNLQVMRANTDLSKYSSALNRVASNGEVVEVDSQGRLVIPQRLRNAKGIEEGELRLCGALGGSIEIHREENYQAQLEEARPVAAEGLAALQQRGLLL